MASHWRHQWKQNVSRGDHQNWRENSRFVRSHPSNYSISHAAGPFTIDKVKLEDLEKGVLTASWKLVASHPSVNADEVEKMQKAVMVGMLLSSAKGSTLR